VRFGEAESRGVALTRAGRARFDAAMRDLGNTRGDPRRVAPEAAAIWARHFPATHADLAAAGLAYYRSGDPTKPVVYEDFLPDSAAGIFRSNLAGDAAAADVADHSDYSLDWMAAAIGHHVHDPYDLYEKAAS
jgi:uncharacterized glyoxalase superfamily metalloenzyme YdcJ